jgi:hypothetical protein
MGTVVSPRACMIRFESGAAHGFPNARQRFPFKFSARIMPLKFVNVLWHCPAPLILFTRFNRITTLHVRPGSL